MRPSNFFGGLIIIAVGALFLGINAGWWSSEIWGQLWRLWPVAIIIVGLRQAVKNDPLFLLLSLAAIGIGAALSYQGLLGAAVVDVNGGPIIHTKELKEEFSKSFNWSTSPEDREMIEFKSEIQVNQLDALAIQLGRHYTVTLTGADTDKETVDFKGPKSIIDDLSLTPEAGRLLLKDANQDRKVFVDLEGVTGTITMPKGLALSLDLSGFADLKIDNHQAGLTVDGSGATTVSFTNSLSHNPLLDLSGTGKVSMDRCDGEAKLKLSGVGSVNANSCTLTKLSVDGSGTSSVDLKAGSVGDFSADTSGVASIKLPKPTGTIDHDKSGASSINYY